MVEKVFFLGQILELEILMDLYVIRSPEYNEHIFIIWSVCMCVYVSLISITQKEITTGT